MSFSARNAAGNTSFQLWLTAKFGGKKKGDSKTKEGRGKMSKYEEALQAINKVHCDQTTSLDDCLTNLISLRDELELLIDAVRGDIERLENE